MVALHIPLDEVAMSLGVGVATRSRLGVVVGEGVSTIDCTAGDVGVLVARVLPPGVGLVELLWREQAVHSAARQFRVR